MNFCLSIIRYASFTCICILFIAFCASDVKADTRSYHLVSVAASRDSLIAAEDENILPNIIILTNTSKKFQRIIIRTIIPDGWRNLSKSKYLEGDDLYYNLYPGQVVKIPVNLLKLPTASPIWTSVRFLVWNREMNTDSQFYSYSIKTLERKTYASAPRDMIMEVDKENKTIGPTLYFRNTGNIEDTYTIKYFSHKLNINDSVIIKLPPGTDSTYVHNIELKNFQVNNISADKVNVSIRNTKSVQNQYTYSIHHYTDESKYNGTPYEEWPLRVEGGYMSSGARHNYYGAASGKIVLGKYRRFDFNYRSKQFSNMPTGIQRHAFKLHYIDRNFTITAGQINMPQYFVSNPFRGLSVNYRFKGLEMRLSGTKHDPLMYIKNDNLAAEFRYKVGKVGVTNTILYNNNLTDSMQSVLLVNDFKIISTKSLKLDIQAGTGFDKYSDNDKRKPDNHRPGLTGGYVFNYKKGHFVVSSRATYMDIFFPGIRKGATNHMHNIDYAHDKGQIGFFYTANYMQVNYFRDSLFNSDILNYNNTRLGFKVTNIFGKAFTTVSAGLMKQIGPLSVNGMGDSYFVDLGSGYTYKKWQANLAVQTAIGKPLDDGQSPFTLVSSANVNSRYFGFNAIYTRIPVVDEENDKRVIREYSQTINGGPQVNFYMFRNMLFGSVRYNISKSSLDNFFTSGVGGSLGYNNSKNGLGVNFNCFVPFRQQTYDPGLPVENRLTAQLSVSKQLNVPVFLKRKYYTLKLIMYDDANANHIMDDGEKEIPGVKMLISDMPFISDKHGEVVYKNIANATYALKISSPEENLVPIDGIEQTIVVNGRTKLMIPFKRGKVIKGRIDVVSDDKEEHIAEYIKITATDANGRMYNTLTDKNGEYSLPVPAAGVYTVSLNHLYAQSSGFIPDRTTYQADLTKKNEENIVFTVRKKTRKIRYLKQ